ETVDELTAPLLEALALLNNGDRAMQREALDQLSQALDRASGFANRHTHVLSREANSFREQLKSAQRIFEHHNRNAGFLPSAVEPQGVVTEEQKGPQPPGDAVTISYADARDPFKYQRAKALAAREGKQLWFVGDE